MKRLCGAVGFLSLFLSSSALAGEAAVWFAPNDLLVRPWKPDQRGPLDFMQLFDSNAPWTSAAKSVAYFQTNLYLIQNLSEPELGKMIGNLRVRGIKLAIEDAAIEYDPACGRSVEGYFAGGYIVSNLQRIRNLGGVVDAYAADSPYWSGSVNPAGCQWSPSESAHRLADLVKQIKAVFPNIAVGSVEPYWAIFGQDAMGNEYGDFLESFQRASGMNLAFLHSDTGPSDSSNWYAALVEAREHARARAIPFGILYNGDDEKSSASWVAAARRKMAAYELQADAPPEHAILQSWVGYPTHVLPETDPTAHTNLILYYSRPRTFAGTTVGTHYVEGHLVDADNQPLPNVLVHLVGVPVNGPGLIHEYRIKGRVPSLATRALVAVRVNNECGGCSAPTDIELYDTSYSEGGANLVANHDFAGGTSSWYMAASEQVSIKSGDQPLGAMLQIATNEKESVAVNSMAFPIAPGQRYTATFKARVAPHSFGGGYFTVIFLGPTANEIARRNIPFETTINGGAMRTGRDGIAKFNPAQQGETGISWRAMFPGNDKYWPSKPRVTSGGVPAYQGLWTAPAASESGSGIYLAHQGDSILATWFTYDHGGKGLWLQMNAQKKAPDTYSGTLYTATGPAFTAVPSNGQVVPTQVGSGTLTFTDSNNAAISYTLNGISGTKALGREQFGPLPVCGTATGSLGATANYQDLWWAAPSGAEPHWGIGLAHQGDVIFGTWFSFDTDHGPLWLSITAQRVSKGVYAGTLYRTTKSSPDATAVTAIAVGTGTLVFGDGNNASFSYSVNGISQTKAITREVFNPPGTMCQ